MPAPTELDDAVHRFLATPLGSPSAPSGLTVRARQRRRRRYSAMTMTAIVLTAACIAGFINIAANRHDGLEVTARSGTSVPTSGATTTPSGPVRHVSDSGAFVATVLPPGFGLLRESFPVDPWYGMKSDFQAFSRNQQRPELGISTIRNLPQSAIKELATVNAGSPRTLVTIDGRPGLVTVLSVAPHDRILAWAVTDKILVEVITYTGLPSVELQRIANGLRAPAVTNATLHGELHEQPAASTPITVYALQGAKRIAALDYILTTFTMSLPPGTYRIATGLDGAGQSCVTKSITVRAREVATVTLQCPTS